MILNYPVILFYRRSSTASLETYPLFSLNRIAAFTWTSSSPYLVLKKIISSFHYLSLCCKTIKRRFCDKSKIAKIKWEDHLIILQNFLAHFGINNKFPTRWRRMGGGREEGVRWGKGKWLGGGGSGERGGGEGGEGARTGSKVADAVLPLTFIELDHLPSYLLKKSI